MPALAVALATLAGCALPEARAPFVDPVSSLIEEWHQEDLANDRGMRFISLVGVYRGATAGDGQLHRIATRILEANAPLCGERIFRHFGLRFAEQSGHAIALLAGAAAEAGLHGDDQVVAIGGERFKTADQANALLHAAAAVRSVRLTVAGVAGQRDVTLQARPRCDVAYVIDESNVVTAFARRDSIVFSRGMLHFARGDAELALIFGHELAHILLGHHDKKDRNAESGAVVGRVMSVLAGEDVTQQFSSQGRRAFQRSFEREADYVGLYYLARAGFDITDTAVFWRRMGIANPAAISEGGTHPTTAERYLAIEAAIAEINAKQTGGQPLLPDRKSP